MFWKLIAEPIHLKTFSLILLAELLLLALSSFVPLAFSTAVALYVAGFFAWTLAEYILHRFIFHMSLNNPLRVLGATLHAAHHASPNKAPITKPPALTLGAFSVSCFLGWVVLNGITFLFFAGMLLGYFFYELSHVAAHVLTSSEHPLPSFQASHLAHHQNPKSRFGITSPLWDYILASLGRS
jgi:4-hydroxysphinganine ceramide fatty acyl 2-hydroxylase